MKNIWAYPADVGYQGQEPLTGFTVETPDGTLGQVERQMNEPGRQHLIVDTSVWVFGKSLLVPAGIVHSVDTAAKTVTVTHARDEIKAAPALRLTARPPKSATSPKSAGTTPRSDSPPPCKERAYPTERRTRPPPPSAPADAGADTGADIRAVTAGFRP